jgi:predicted O-linked N-acetylglucosamine transferase (SPINDLY family)
MFGPRHLWWLKSLLPSLSLPPCLASHTRYTYFLAFARVARVQATFFGHPTTSGLPSMDYFLTSELIEMPPGQAQSHYSEQLVNSRSSTAQASSEPP